jgi:hypothetical protein
MDQGNLGEVKCDRWSRERQRSLTGGPVDARCPSGGNVRGGGGDGREPASWRTGLDDAVVLGRRGGNDPRSFSLLEFLSHLNFQLE